ncbi:FIG00696983: hypothetical protein [hydrothermal vent metagenome]|uniref:DUF3800 domain-containing protein n=1 Tax=hydrothermal vent metagenome TaxID=652676 RepID=A0A3B1B1Z4_9ZZZZ
MTTSKSKFSEYIIYVDESGDHGLVNVDPSYPVFVLAFCLFAKEEYLARIIPAIQGFKFRHFGHDMVIQAGRPVLDFSWLDSNRAEYFSAVQAGLDNSEPMKVVFRQVLLDSERSVS